MFAANSFSPRRTLYGLVDRQFVPATMRTFDFANPDLHVPQRAETTVPLQALFAMNDPFVADRARALASRVESLEQTDSAEAVRRLYRHVFQREPTGEQLEGSLGFLAVADDPESTRPQPEVLAWSYGYGTVNESTGRLKNFTTLPHFTGTSWQGGANWPDAGLGWVRITADGGHAGNDLQHAAVRRWTAPRDGTVRVSSTVIHDVAAGDGIRSWIISSRHGVLSSATVFNAEVPMRVDDLAVRTGDTLDFVVDYRANLNSDQFLWTPRIRDGGVAETSSAGSGYAQWNARRDFAGPVNLLLRPWEQLAQVLLISNELMFVD
jgi:hypothetical protein